MISPQWIWSVCVPFFSCQVVCVCLASVSCGPVFILDLFFMVFGLFCLSLLFLLFWFTLSDCWVIFFFLKYSAAFCYFLCCLAILSSTCSNCLFSSNYAGLFCIFVDIRTESVTARPALLPCHTLWRCRFSGGLDLHQNSVAAFTAATDSPKQVRCEKKWGRL